jgi:two-component system cell cycle sensor histidine kinase/response regulator CckA
MPGPRENSVPFSGDGLTNPACKPQAIAPTQPRETAEALVRRQRFEDAAKIARRLGHDFGNLLTGLLGFSELSLSLLSKESPAYQYVAEIHRSAMQGAEFTQQLRWFSRPVASPSDATSLADAVIVEEDRIRKAHGNRLQLTTAELDGLPPVRLEREALRQVLRQLLGNAIEAQANPANITLRASVVELSAERCGGLLGEPTPGPCVELEIADCGHGLSEEAREKVLVEPFFSTKHRHHGLGLAMVFGILRGCGGGFSLENGPAGGAVARCYLPLAAQGVSATAGQSARADGERLLVVDDDPMVLQLVCSALEKAGYRVEPAASGEEALRRYAAAGSDGFRLVVSDVVMPGVSGIELARRLLHQDASLNLLFMSGHATTEFPDSSLVGGRFELLAKPFRAEGLLRAVRRALDRVRSRSLSAGEPGCCSHPAPS